MYNQSLVKFLEQTQYLKVAPNLSLERVTERSNHPGPKDTFSEAEYLPKMADVGYLKTTKMLPFTHWFLVETTTNASGGNSERNVPLITTMATHILYSRP